MLDAVPVHDLGWLLELLTPDAVEPLVFAGEDVVRVALANPVDERGHRGAVARLGGADPVVVRAAELAPRVREPRRDAIHPGLRGQAVLLGRLRDLLPVLVHAHDVMDRVARQPAIAGDAVRADLLEGMPQVRLAVRIIDGGGEVKLSHPRLRP